MNLIIVIRWIHVIAAGAWLGEVIVINAVIVPLLNSTEPERRGAIIAKFFPRLFRLASILALLALLSGLVMSYLATGWQDLGAIIQTRWGLGILIGGSLGLLLAIFHFTAENRLRPIASSLDQDATPEDVEQVMRFLRIVPRIGLVVILTVYLFMMLAARG